MYFTSSHVLGLVSVFVQCMFVIFLHTSFRFKKFSDFVSLRTVLEILDFFLLCSISSYAFLTLLINSGQAARLSQDYFITNNAITIV